MPYKHLFIFVLILSLASACSSGEKASQPAIAPAPEITPKLKVDAAILSSKNYINLPSASGLEKVGNRYFILSDDSPYLYQLNEQQKVTKKYALIDTSNFKGGRIPKAIKPDLESMSQLIYGRDTLLLLLGSGSAATRNGGFLVNVTENYAVRPLDLTRFYTFLKRVLKIETDGILNIEGLAIDKAYAYLLQRPFGGRPNVLFRFNADDFKDFILRDGPIPAVAVYHFDLPALNGVPSGFSGAYALGDKLFFTASVENTPDAIQDGEVLGSFVGIIPLRDLPYATNPASPLLVPVAQLKASGGTAFKGKAESLVVTELVKDKYKVVIVTDDDQGSSEMLEVELYVQKL